MHVCKTSRLTMIINALIISTPNSPNISLESYLPPSISQLESSSTDSESDHDEQPSSNLSNTENDILTWHDQLAKSLISLHHDIHLIITGFDEISQNTTENVQDKKTRLELMRIALMLNPSDLPTYNNEESTSPYSDLMESEDRGNPFIQKQSYRHETLRSKIQRLVSQLKRCMEKLRLVLFGSSDKNKSSYYTSKYRKRIQRSLSEIREQMIEYNRINKTLEQEKQDDELTKHQKSINHIMTTIVTSSPLIEQRIDDYRAKLRGNEHKENYEFISSPFIPLESESYQKPLPIKDKDEDHFDLIQPLNFPDLKDEANEFFGSEPLTSSNIIQ